MNAYELANYITENSYIGSVTMDGVANMLRQQADEIQALKDGFNTAWGGTNNSELAEVRAMANRMILKVKEQADRITELEKLFNNCNVSDFTPPQKAIIRQGFEKYWGEIWERYTEETTPQIKELSDEEIQEISHDFGEIAWLGETTYNFARAILKKASEKRTN